MVVSSSFGKKIMISDEHGEPQFEQKKIDRVRAPLQ